ncbi:MAG: SET domain-containing protein-lysine N-methyltransferase [bacterium]
MEKKSYLSPKVKKDKSKAGWGLFAIEPIDKDELLIDFTNGRGKLIDLEEAERLYEQGNDRMIRVSDDMYFSDTTPDELEDVDLVNHSCEPNCGMQGNYKIVAMRDIKSGEEITIDYAMLENADYELACLCGSEVCRGTVTGYDWKQKKLQGKYRGYFTEYIIGKIESL